LGAGFSKDFTPIPFDNLIALLRYINQGVPYELSELAITILGANAQILAENVPVERAGDIDTILDTLFDHISRSRYFLQKNEIIAQIADIAANESVPWSIRAKALLFFQALSQSPDKSIGHILAAQSQRINLSEMLL
ncbi:hypothetical protein RZS08_39470, partial [Arthrospira platensis SPKY1]|nr:hypothetical protein [Arthrospira platensis SPKY1]